MSNKFEPKEDVVETQETHEAYESREAVVENVEEIKKQMLAQSEQEVAQFQKETSDELAQDQARAEEEGLEINNADKEELQGLEREAEVAEGELKAGVGGEDAKEKMSPKQQDAFNKGKEKILSLQAEGNDKSPEYWALYSHLTEGFGTDIQWRDAADIDVKKIEEMLAKKFPEKDQIVVRSCPKCGREYSSVNTSYCTECGSELELKKQEGKSDKESEKTEVVEVVRDRNFKDSVIVKTKDVGGRIVGYALRKNSGGAWEGNEIGYMKDGSISWVQQLHQSDFAKLEEEGVLAQYENAPKMKERAVEKPELLTAKESSKKLMSEERIKLAQEIRQERNAQKERLTKLKSIVEVGQEKAEGEEGDKQYGRLSEIQSHESNLLAKRIISESVEESDVREEQEIISNLIDSSEGLKMIKQRLEDHYAKADVVAKRKFETIRKNVDQVMLRNDAFIVHAFLTNESLRHNANSNISGRATLEDDINILLSLEPSISASSIKTGSRHGLWSEKIGVLIGGGEIMGGAQTDNQTQTGGIKYRNGTKLSSEKIDELVSDAEDRSYNELVINNPKIFGFYQTAFLGENGELLGFESRTAGDNKSNRDEFMNYMDLAQQKGMPQLIMTPDRHIFEFISISENGIITVGQEVTSAQVATGAAGLSGEIRKSIGQEVISRNLFRKLEDQKEAKKILAELSDAEKVEEIQLSRDEYIKWLQDNGGGIQQLPEELCNDKEFMLEAALVRPDDAYMFAGEDLKRDIDFIKQIYSVRSAVEIYRHMPENLKKNEAIAELAIQNNDLRSLDLGWAESPAIWDKLTDKLAENVNPASYFSYGDGNVRVLDTNLIMYKDGIGENMRERVASDQNLVKKLNEKYPGYKFETDDYSQLLVTRLE